MLKQFSPEIESAAERIASVLSGDAPNRYQASRGKLPYGHTIIGMATPEEIVEKARIAAEKKASEQRRMDGYETRRKPRIEKACLCGKVMSLLPWQKGRRYCSIGCRNRFILGAKLSKYVFTEEMDAEIIKAYQEDVGMCHRAVTQDLADKYGIPDWRVRSRGRELGVANNRRQSKNPPPWSDEEIRIITENFHLSLATIQAKLREAGFTRTIGSVQTKHFRILSARKRPGSYTATHLARLFGVHNTSVLLWIRKGLLKAAIDRREQSKNLYEIMPEDVRQFIVDHVEVVDLRKVDKFWLVDLLTGKEDNDRARNLLGNRTASQRDAAIIHERL